MQRAMIKLPKGRVVSNGPKNTWNLIYVPDGQSKPTSKLLGKLDEISEREAHRIALEFLEDEKRRMFTVDRVIAAYEQAKLGEDASISKRENYRMFHRKIARRFGSEVLENLIAGEFEDWVNALRLAPRSKGEVRGQMSRLWKFARKRRMVSRALANPMDEVDIPEVTARVRPTVAMTPEIFRAFLAHLKEPYATFALASVSHGLRRAEALGLKWLDIAFEERTIFIRRTFVRGKVQERTKTQGSTVRFEMDEELVEHLAVWRMNTPFPGDEDWIFPSPGGRGRKPGELPLSVDSIGNAYRAAGRRIGLGRVNTHVMRYSHCSWLVMRKVPPKIAQIAMRHANFQTTMDIYATVLNPQEAGRAQKLATRMAFGKEGDDDNS